MGLFSTCGTFLALVAPIRWLTSAAAVLGVVSMVIVVEAISQFLVVACMNLELCQQRQPVLTRAEVGGGCTYRQCCLDRAATVAKVHTWAKFRTQTI